MPVVCVSEQGAIIGRIIFRGIVITMPDGSAKIPYPEQEPSYECDPPDCVPEHVIQRIAGKLATNSVVGEEPPDYDWQVE